MRVDMQILIVLAEQPGPASAEQIQAALTPTAGNLPIAACYRFLNLFVDGDEASLQDGLYTITESGRQRYISLTAAATLTAETRRILSCLKNKGPQSKEGIQLALGHGVPQRDLINLQHVEYIEAISGEALPSPPGITLQRTGGYRLTAKGEHALALQ